MAHWIVVSMKYKNMGRICHLPSTQQALNLRIVITTVVPAPPSHPGWRFRSPEEKDKGLTHVPCVQDVN